MAGRSASSARGRASTSSSVTTRSCWPRSPARASTTASGRSSAGSPTDRARMRRRRWMLAGAAAVAVAAGVLAFVLGRPAHKVPPPPERGLEIGLQDNAVFLERRYYDREAALGQARQLGVTWMRTNLLWS